MPVSPRPAAAVALMAALLGAAATATAQQERGLYGRLYLGANTISTDSLTLTDGNTTQTATADFTAAFTGGGALGFRYGERWRVEADVTYRSAEVDRVQFGTDTPFTDGNFASLTIGLTGIYDLPALGNRGNWRPYLGAGLGWLQEVDVDFEDVSGETSYSGDEVALSVLAGLRYQSDRRWFIDGELRYFNIGDVEMTGEEGATGTVSADYDPLSITFGFGYAF